MTASELAHLGRELAEIEPKRRRDKAWKRSQSTTRELTRALHAEGKVAAEIAVELGIAEKTVRSHLEKPEVPA